MDDLNPQPSFTKPQIQSKPSFVQINRFANWIFNDIHDSNPTVKSEGLQPI